MPTVLRRNLARFANLGLLVFGLALVVVLSTGGTRFDVGSLTISLRRVAPPLQWFALFVALRVLVASRASGLESRMVAFFARMGLHPRDRSASILSSARFGAELGIGFSVVAAIADITHLVLLSGPPYLSAGEWITAGTIALALGATMGLVAGAMVGAAVVAAAQTMGRRLGRYEAGRWTIAVLAFLTPGVVWWAPETVTRRMPPDLLTIAGAVILTLILVFLVIPAAVVRARRGRWGMAIVVIAAASLATTMGGITFFTPGVGGGNDRRGDYPNVLLVTVTGLRFDHLGLEKGRWDPGRPLHLLASNGTVLTDAQATSTASLASIGSLLTGLYPQNHRLRRTGDRLSARIDGLPDLLASHGYRTAAFVSSRVFEGRSSGLARRFDLYDDPKTARDWAGRLTVGRVALGWWLEEPSPFRPDDEAVDAFLEWRIRDPSGPWFAWVQLAAPARPRPVPVGGRDAAESDPQLISAPPWAEKSDRQRPRREWLAGYEQATAKVDRSLARLMATLEARGENLQTVIFVVGERGQLLGEEGLWFETGQSLAQPLIHVPWLAVGPGIRSGQRVPGPCSLVDFVPTVLGLVGLGGVSEAEGEDLSAYLRGSGAKRDPHTGPVYCESRPAPSSGRKRRHAVRFGAWKLIRGVDGRESLYHSRDDFASAIAERSARSERLRSYLSDMLSRQLGRNDPPMPESAENDSGFGTEKTGADASF